MTTTRLALLLTITALVAAPARAQKTPQPPADDIRCLMVASLMVNSTDATQRAAGSMLAIYSLGRLNAFSAQEIEDAIVSENDSITPTQIKTESVRCGTVLQEKGQMMQQIGQNIMRRAKDQQKSAPAKAPAESQPTT